MKAATFGMCALLVVSAVALADQPAISWTWSTPKEAPDAQPGKLEFERACAVCHGEGPDRPGTSSLQIKYDGAVPALLEQRTDLSPEFVRYYIRNGFAMMPKFRKTELSEQEVDAISRYLARAR